MTTKQTRAENKKALTISEKILKHCQDKYPPVEGAKAMLLASACMAKSLGVSRKVFLDTAKQMLAGLEVK